MNLIALQWDLIRLDPQANIEKAGKLLESVRPEQGDIVILPELWPTGYGKIEELRSLIDRYGRSWHSFLKECAVTYGIYMAGGSVPEIQRDDVFNRLHILNPGGENIGSYDKLHLFPPMHEEQLFTPGSRAHPVKTDLPDIVFGPVICYDLRFPELFRHLANQGASLFVLPAEFPDPKEDIWHTLLSARAAENQSFLVASNRIGRSGSFTFFGSSAVYDPLGRCLGRLGREEGALKVAIDTHVIKETRTTLPVLSHTRLTISP
jgi:predicted amidohydrolase